MHAVLLVTALFAVAPETPEGQDWPGFLGVRRDSATIEVVAPWGESGPPLLWSIERGESYASPVVIGDRVVFTHRIDDVSHVDCLDRATGQRHWRHSFPTTYSGEYIRNSGPRATPVVADDTVFVHGIEGEMIALALETGDVEWERDLTKELGAPESFFGVVASPLVVDDVVIANVGATGGPCVVALDRRTGETVWGAGDEWGASCASPVAATIHGRDRVLVVTGGKTRPPTGGLMVIDPANGDVDFSFPFRSKTYTSVNGASPVVVGDAVFLTASYSTGSVMLDLDADGGFAERWKKRRFGLQFGTPIVHDGALYCVEGSAGLIGAITRLDPADGTVSWRTEIDETIEFEVGDTKRKMDMSVGEGALTMLGDGRLLCLGDTGLLVLLEVGDTGARVLAKHAGWFAPDTWTPPVVARGTLLLAQNSVCRFTEATPRLLAYDVRAEQ